MFVRIDYPLSDDKRSELEYKCKAWLDNQFDYWSGEWWCNVFPKEILIEEDISPEVEFIAIGFYVFSVIKKFISLNKKTRTILKLAGLMKTSSCFLCKAIDTRRSVASCFRTTLTI